jgi:BASS family bile acid:Na+ symporter
MNLSRIEASVTHLVSLVFIIAIIIGLLWQSAAAFINPSIAYLLMIVIALGFIRVDVKSLKQELENWPYQLWLLVLSMVICPLVVYYLIVLGVHLGWLDASFETGGLLFFSVSTGATAPAIVMLLQGKFTRTMLNLALTSLAIIVTLPLMFTLFSTTHLHFSFIALLLFLVKLIVVPLIVAVMLRRIIPKFTESLAQHVPALSVLLLFFVIFGCVSGLDHFFHDSMSSAGFLLFVKQLPTESQPASLLPG